MVDKVIRTENADDFIKEYFIEYRSMLRKLKEGLNRSLGFGSTTIHTPEPTPMRQLDNKVLISNESGLIVGDSLKFEIKEWFNSRCYITQTFIYKIEYYDSLSVKGTLEKYYITPIYNN